MGAAAFLGASAFFAGAAAFAAAFTGAAFLAGLSSKYYKNLDHIRSIHHCQKLFTPNMDEEEREKLYNGWKKAVEVTRMFK